VLQVGLEAGCRKKRFDVRPRVTVSTMKFETVVDGPCADGMLERKRGMPARP
jgi:hypothetical protein